MNNRTYITIKDAADFMGVAPITIRRYIKENVSGIKDHVTQVKPLGRIHIDRAGFEEWLSRVKP